MEGEKSEEDLHNVLKINLGWFCSSLLSLCLLSSPLLSGLLFQAYGWFNL